MSSLPRKPHTTPLAYQQSATRPRTSSPRQRTLISLALLEDSSNHLLETALENPVLAHRSLALRKQLLGTKDKEVWIVSEGNQQYVAKVLNMELMSQNERRFAMNEVKCLSNCDHPNIIRYVADYEHEGTILLLMEHAPSGDLRSQVRARSKLQSPPQTTTSPPTPLHAAKTKVKKHFRQDDALTIFAQLCLAVDHIHSANMMHRDIKTQNIFVMPTGLLKLGDFGFTRQYDVTISGTPGGTFCGTPHYLSPEICTHQPYGKKSDIFAMGVVLYELLALEHPFQGTTVEEIKAATLRGQCRPVIDVNPQCSPELARLCHAMLALDPERRPSLQHIFATSLMRVALSDLRVAVAAMTKIPDTDRRAMREHIERVIGGSACVRVRWSNSHGVAPSHVPVDVDLELVVSTCGTGVELRPWVSVPAVMAPLRGDDHFCGSVSFGTFGSLLAVNRSPGLSMLSSGRFGSPLLTTADAFLSKSTSLPAAAAKKDDEALVEVMYESTTRFINSMSLQMNGSSSSCYFSGGVVRCVQAPHDSVVGILLDDGSSLYLEADPESVMRHLMSC
eukprot:PhM_4_TR10024/c4_g1_i8/m.94861/K08857/NEK1_4_5; NIMA (never in mitosis gene a)-related kinase 1/4/5